MQKLGISLFFFTLCFATISYGQGRSQSHQSFPNIDSILASVNIDSIMHRVNIDSIMHRVNIDSIMRRVNIDSIMHRVNVDSLMGHLNIDSLLKRFNIDSLWKANRSKINEFLNSYSSNTSGVRGNPGRIVNSSEFSAQGSITINSSSLVASGDTIFGKGQLTPEQRNELNSRTYLFRNNGPTHYFAKNGKQYYLNIISPTQKGTRVDSSYVWLLGSR